MLKYRLLFTLDLERDPAPLWAEGQSDGGAGGQNLCPASQKGPTASSALLSPALPAEAGLAPGKRWHQATAR